MINTTLVSKPVQALMQHRAVFVVMIWVMITANATATLCAAGSLLAGFINQHHGPPNGILPEENNQLVLKMYLMLPRDWQYSIHN